MAKLRCAIFRATLLLDQLRPFRSNRHSRPRALIQQIHLHTDRRRASPIVGIRSSEEHLHAPHGSVRFHRTGLDDSNCFRRANQESSAIFQRLTALPEWKRQQCDLVMQVEGAASAPQGCLSSQIVKPVPFLGTAEEVIVLADGSVWKDLSYKYLYLYAYSPMVQICAAQSKMILEHGGTTHTFSLMRLR